MQEKDSSEGINSHIAFLNLIIFSSVNKKIWNYSVQYYI